MNSKPLVSVIVPTKDSAGQLRTCLNGIRRQTYKNIEIVVSDGMSKDATLKIAKEYKVRVITNKKILAEPGVRLGFQKAKGEILVVLAIDNIFKEKTAIETIVNVFENKKIFAAFPMHDSVKKDTIFTKYTNVFTDPFNHFVYGYASNARTFKKVFKTIIHNSIYDVYDFRSAKIKPILAIAQGFSVRKEFVNRNNNQMDDISPVLELIKEGKQIAYVHSVALYHHTINSLEQFIRKQRWGAKNALSGKEFGINSRLNTLSKEQKIRMYLFPIYSLSIIIPCINSLFHLLKDKEKMWLFHPIITFVSGIAITFEYVKIKLGLSKSISRL
jgi:glycosyltransferase involved in cell wall biosynthesis